MGLYRRYLAPLLINATCSSKVLGRARRATCEGLSGDVLEIGFGAGNNVDFYPEGVNRVYAVEPSDLAWRLAHRRLATRALRIERVSTHGESIDLPDASCDAALCTFTLCSVADPERTLAEVARVLRPGAILHLAEHGLAPDPRVARWQRRLEPLERRVADGCHLTRDPVELVIRAGFEFVRLDQGFAPGPRPWTYITVATARRAGPA